MDSFQKSVWVKRKAHELGFDQCGIAKAEKLDEDARRLEAWLSQGMHGSMNYMANHFELRTDPRELVPGAKSVICLSLNYYTEQSQTDPEAPKISKYAYGRDYHKVVKKKLKLLLSAMQAEFGEINGRCFVDSAPVLERAWAQRAGIGWVGKNTLLLSKAKGSYFFLAEIICDLELEADSPVKDFCGNCTRCIDACPTDAIYAPYQMDGSKCISYLTIELKDEIIPKEFTGKMENWMYGCDICQQVCPINARAQQNSEPDFEPKDELLSMSKQDWQEITEAVFDRLFEGSAVKRTKYEGLKRNILFLESRVENQDS